MQIKSLVLFLILNLFLFAQDAFAECIQIPTCAELGYTYTAKECNGVKSLVCPFDANKLFCPEDCSTYKLDSCNSNIGKCRQCARNGKWKYESCDGDGWMLSDGNCVPNSCSSTEGFRIEKLDAMIGTVETCTKGTTLTYRYSSCKDGWLHQIPSYNCTVNPCEGFETQSVVCPGTTTEQDRCGESCPSNATCDEKCKSGTQIKAKVVCEDGFFLQDKGDFEGELYECRKHKIGNIAFYCKNPSKISELATELASETGNTSYLKIDDNNDQIISLEHGYYDKARDYDCYAIGIVFYNDTTTKIVGLKDIGYSTSKPYFTEQRSGYYPTAAWSSCSSDSDECNTGIENTTESSCWSVAIDGADNSDKIIAWLHSKLKGDGSLKYTAPAAQATRAYYPRLCTYLDGKENCDPICPYVDEENPLSSACSNGKWYFPSVTEFNHLRSRYLKTLFPQAQKEIVDNNVGFSSNFLNYWTSAENSKTNAFLWFENTQGPYSWSKSGAFKVRPVLVIE